MAKVWDETLWASNTWDWDAWGDAGEAVAIKMTEVMGVIAFGGIIGIDDEMFGEPRGLWI